MLLASPAFAGFDAEKIISPSLGPTSYTRILFDKLAGAKSAQPPSYSKYDIANEEPMRVAVFSTKPYDREALSAANDGRHDLQFFEARLAPETAGLAAEFDAICPFVNDDVDAETVDKLADGRTRLLALRSAGFNHVDLDAASAHGITVARVPAYSPNAVAEHALALILTLNRKMHRAYNRVREGNFSLDGLMGFTLSGKTVGVVGTGSIGAVFAQTMDAMGCRVLASDPNPARSLADRVEYVELAELFTESDIISLHCPLIHETHHMIDAESIATMKEGVMLINTSRGGLIDTQALIDGLKSGQVGHVGLDVYEEEEGLFFEDLSNHIIRDDVFMRLLTFPNVVITGHQGFFTEEALRNIAETTIANVTAFETGDGELHEVK
jgi:D-lactate dehydrogenase